MTTEAKIREAYFKHLAHEQDIETLTHRESFTAGYMALLNELELSHYTQVYLERDVPLYLLPEGVEK